MKRVLLDHCVPRKVRLALPGCTVETAHRLGWNQLRNGELLTVAENAGFEVFVTSDKNLRYQQNLATRRIAILVLPTNDLAALLPHFPAIEAAAMRALPGGYAEL